MRSFFGLSIITTTLLVILGTLFLFWTPTSHKDITAAVINAPALVVDKAPKPTGVAESTTTKASAPVKIDTALPENTIATAQSPTAEINKMTRPPTPTQPTNLTTLIHSLTNTARAKDNRAVLSFDTKLSDLAKERSEDMIRQNYFSHTSPNSCDLSCRFKNSNYQTLTWGENLAESTSHDMLSNQELAEMFMESWLNSNGHRDNLLSKKFTHQGIGTAVKGGRIVVTVVFATP